MNLEVVAGSTHFYAALELFPVYSNRFSLVAKVFARKAHRHTHGVRHEGEREGQGWYLPSLLHLQELERHCGDTAQRVRRK